MQMLNKKRQFQIRAPHLDKTDFQIQRNPRNGPPFHHKKYRLMLDPLIIIPFRKCIFWNFK